MTTKVLTPEESKIWQKKIADTVDAEPMKFVKADDAMSPFTLEVANGQSPTGGKTLIIHVFKRADIHPDKAVEVFQHALVDVFGAAAGAQAECDYRNVAELKKRFGDQHLASETHDSMTVIFVKGPVPYTRGLAWVRDNMARSLRKWYDRSFSW